MSALNDFLLNLMASNGATVLSIDLDNAAGLSESQSGSYPRLVLGIENRRSERDSSPVSVAHNRWESSPVIKSRWKTATPSSSSEDTIATPPRVPRRRESVNCSEEACLSAPTQTSEDVTPPRRPRRRVSAYLGDNQSTPQLPICLDVE